MYKNLGLLLIVYSLIGHVTLLDIPFISDIQDLIGLAHDVGDIVSGNVPLKSLFVATVNPIDTIMKTVNELVNQVTDLGNQLNNKLDSIMNIILIRVPLEGKIDSDMKDIINSMAKIDGKYEDFEVYAEFFENFNERTILDYIHFIIGSNTGELQDILQTILLTVVPMKTTLQRATLLENIKHLRNVSDTKELCDVDISFQYRLYKIYTLLMIAELKAFIMTQFAYKQLNDLENQKAGLPNDGSSKFGYIGELQRAQAKYIMRANQYQIEVKRVMQGSSREIYRCGPKKLVLDQTHWEFERLFQNYVIHEKQINDCSKTCSDLGIIDSHEDTVLRRGGLRGFDFHYHIEDKCNGRLKDCTWIGGKVTICENPKHSAKRYQFINSHSMGYYGAWSSCQGAYSKEVHDFPLEFNSCDVCLCTCAEENANSLSIRTISLRPQLSNIGENKVVSNIRFLSKDYVIHIQIEESILSPVGLLNPNYTAWVPVGDFQYFSDIDETGGFKLKTGDGYSDLKKNEDYVFITFEQNRLNLDEISAGSGYVVTGARLNVEDSSNNKSPIELQIHVTPFKFTTGELIPTDDNPSKWIKAKTQPNPPHEYTKERTKYGEGEKVLSSEEGTFTPVPMKNKYVEFTKSDKHDASQSTIPFIDARPVITSRNIAFEGVGMVYYESDKKHAGIVGLKMMTIDVAPYVKPNLKPQQLKFYKKFYRGPLRFASPRLE